LARDKKTGPVDQRVVERPGEFSNLVHEWDIGVIVFGSYQHPKPKFFKIKEQRPKIQWVLNQIKPFRDLAVKGAEQGIKKNSC
jgi:hypothetical protein